MFPTPENPLSLSKILGGLSHTLNIAKRAIPIYESAKPMINNAKNAYKKISSTNINNTKKIKTINYNNRFHNPTFFK